jgi:hypothetical protein
MFVCGTWVGGADNTQWGCFDAKKPGWVGSIGWGLRCRFRCHVPPVPVLGWGVKKGGGGRERNANSSRRGGAGGEVKPR